MTNNQKISLSLTIINTIAEIVYKRYNTDPFRPLTKKRITKFLISFGSNTIKKIL